MSTGRRTVALADNTIGPEEIAAVTEVLAGGWLSAGPRTAEFERAFARALGVPAAVAVNSGTAALHVALAALGVGPGDEVITPALTFVSGAAMTVLLGATPVFADVRSPTDLSIDPAHVAGLISDRTRAVIATHYGGFGADLPALRELTAAHGLALVEDAAHAPVVTGPDGFLGSVGDAGCFSFYATKNVTTGEGGLVVARDPEVLDRCRRMRSHFMTASTWDREQGTALDYDVTAVGMNYRPTEITSALGIVQLGRLAADRAARARVTTRYRRLLADRPDVVVPYAERDLATEDSALHLFVVLLPGPADRTEVRRYLRERGVQTSVHYPPTHRLSAYRNRSADPRTALPVTDAVAPRLLSLPLHARMTEVDADYVVEVLAEALERSR